MRDSYIREQGQEVIQVVKKVVSKLIGVFLYVCQELQAGVPKSSSKIKVNDGNSIHCLKEYLCGNWNNNNCEYFNEGSIVIDLTTITGYQAGEKFLGDLQKVGWLVLRKLNANQEVKEKIEEISNKGKRNSISTEKNRMMKYN